MVVEDEIFIRMQIVDTLTEAGWDVLEFATGEGAIGYLGSARNVDLLVSDIRLQGNTTGWDVTQAYRDRFPPIGVIYCSGNSPDEVRRVPGSVFLHKPCNMEKLLATARDLVSDRPAPA